MPNRRNSHKTPALREQSWSERALEIVYHDPRTLTPRANNPRTHSRRQIKQIVGSIEEFAFLNPVLISGQSDIIAGHGRVEAAILLGMTEIPTVRVDHLTPEQIRAYVIADNKLAELAGWDRNLLALELGELSVLPGFDVTVTGFETAEIDILIGELGAEAPDEADNVFKIDRSRPAVSQLGDLWRIDEHFLFCGNALEKESYIKLLGGKTAQLVFTDPPYNVPIAGNVSGLGKNQHSEFAMASGEMSRDQFVDFLSVTFARLCASSSDGSIHYICMDWRHIREVLDAAEQSYGDPKNICVWTKTNGGMGSLYRVQDRKLLVVPEEAATVKMIFERYLALGSILKLLEELRDGGTKTKRRPLATGKTVGGVPFTQGPMGYLLGNRIYLGEIVHQGQSYPGEHEPVIDRALFEGVQNLRSQNLVQHRAKRAASNALLLGRFFDDAGNVMSPTHSRKRGLRYRYYISRALMEGRKSEAGTVARVSAEDVETKVVEALAAARGSKAGQDTEFDDARTIIRTMVSRVVIGTNRLTIELSDDTAESIGRSSLFVSWTAKPGKPKRDLVLPINSDDPAPRPIHAERRAKHLRAIALGRKWLQDLITGKANDVDAIATREGRSARSVNMMISLAFVAPDIVEAAAAGRLPRGIGVTRLVDLPMSWARQKEALGLPARF